MDEENVGCKGRERSGKKGSGWTEKNGDWESEDIKDFNKPIDMCPFLYITNSMEQSP
jgi:hypothetical protein